MSKGLAPGSVFGGRYRIVKLLGMGGMGSVYLANATGLAGFEKLVALKVAHAHVAADTSDMELFLSEARLTAMLQHANLGQVYDLGESDGVYFIAMEYVEGVDLRTLMNECAAREARLPLPIAVSIVCRMLEGLDYAHALRDRSGRPLKLVHRDVSPVNCLVSRTGDVKVIDFGIAKAAVQRGKTKTGIVRGKLDYMSPEQCRGWPLDKRSDVFAAGIVLYELLVGDRPFWHENDLELMKQIVSGSFVRPSELDPELPPELDAAVVKALAPDREERFATAGDFQGALEAWLQQSQVRVGARELAAFVNDLCPGAPPIDPNLTREQITGLTGARETPIAEQQTRLLQPPAAVIKDTVLAAAPPHDSGEQPVVVPRTRRKLSAQRAMTQPRPAPSEPRPPRALALVATAVAAALISGAGFLALTRLAATNATNAANETTVGLPDAGAP